MNIITTIITDSDRFHLSAIRNEDGSYTSPWLEERFDNEKETISDCKDWLIDFYKLLSNGDNNYLNIDEDLEQQLIESYGNDICAEDLLEIFNKAYEMGFFGKTSTYFYFNEKQLSFLKKNTNTKNSVYYKVDKFLLENFNIQGCLTPHMDFYLCEVPDNMEEFESEDVAILIGEHPSYILYQKFVKTLFELNNTGFEVELLFLKELEP